MREDAVWACKRCSSLQTSEGPATSLNRVRDFKVLGFIGFQDFKRFQKFQDFRRFQVFLGILRAYKTGSRLKLLLHSRQLLEIKLKILLCNSGSGGVVSKITRKLGLLIHRW